jgi:hypothetical protein
MGFSFSFTWYYREKDNRSLTRCQGVVSVLTEPLDKQIGALLVLPHLTVKRYNRLTNQKGENSMKVVAIVNQKGGVGSSGPALPPLVLFEWLGKRLENLMSYFCKDPGPTSNGENFE